MLRRYIEFDRLIGIAFLVYNVSIAKSVLVFFLHYQGYDSGLFIARRRYA